MEVNKDNWFQELFIDEAKTALNKNASPTDAQVEAALFKYFDRNPINNIEATIENNVLVVT